MNIDQYQNHFREKALQQGFSAENIDKCINYAIPLLNNKFPIIFNTSHFCSLVGYNKIFINRVAVYTSYFYRSFKIKKRNGQMRTIEEPLPSLKEIQHWILNNILEKFDVSPFAKAYKKKHNLKENVRFHSNQETVLNLDIKNFFPSIKSKSIEGIFKNMGYSPLVSNLLAKLCTRNKILPQGAPTSPFLSNIFMKEIDDAISKYCILGKIKYTRYADDMTFSGTFDKDNLSNFVEELLKIHDLELNHEKTHYLKKNQRQIVTGIVVNQKLQVPFEKRNAIRSDLYYIKKFGIEEHKTFRKIKKSNYISHLLGKINFILNINPNDQEFKEYKQFLINLKQNHPLL